MNRRFCPSDEELANYLSGSLPESARAAIEEHLSSCHSCRTVIAEAYDVLKKPSFRGFLAALLSRLRENLWLLPSVVFLFLSFLFKRYFLQFLSACLICAVKWIIDSKATHLLIMVNRSLRGESPQTDPRRNQKDHSPGK